MERPKYLEYRHRRGNIARFAIKRTQTVTVEKPAAAILRAFGKKTAASSDSFDEEWNMELRTTDVKPDWSALVKIQVTEAARLVKGEKLAYTANADPTTDFLNETVDRFGLLGDHNGSLPTPHLFLFPEEPKRSGEEWTRARDEQLQISGPDGQVKSNDARSVTYTGRIDQFGTDEDGVEFADLAFSGTATITEGEEFSEVYEVVGRGRFAIRDGYIMSAQVTRSNITTIDKVVITRSVKENFVHDSSGEEKTVGGMRI